MRQARDFKHLHKMFDDEDWQQLQNELLAIDLSALRSSQLWFYQATCHRLRGEPELALKPFAEALALDPCADDLRIEAAETLQEAEEWESALGLLKQPLGHTAALTPLGRWIAARSKAYLDEPHLAEKELLILQDEGQLDLIRLGIGLTEVNLLIGDIPRAMHCHERLKQAAGDTDRVLLLELQLLRQHDVNGFPELVNQLIRRSGFSRLVMLKSADALVERMFLEDADRLYRDLFSRHDFKGRFANSYLSFLALRGRIMDLEQYLALAQSSYPPITPDLFRAQGLMAAGRYVEAKDLLESLPSSLHQSSLLFDALREQGAHNQALLIAIEVCQKYPDHAEWRMRRAKQCLFMGNWKDGWLHYESRFALKNSNKIVPKGVVPLRSNEPPESQHVLVFGEQGFGDTIMMASMLPDLLDSAASVTLLVQPRLSKIFGYSFPQLEVLSSIDSDKYQSFDRCYGLGSLGKFFRSEFSLFPGNKYLTVAHADLDRWKDELNRLGSGLKVGVAWRGGGGLTSSRQRSLDVMDLAEILTVPGVQWVNLQYKHRADELTHVEQELGVCIHHFDGVTVDLYETLALTQSLDLVVTVQQTALHMAGAVGTPAWVLLPLTPEWRYGCKGNQMAWYNSVELFRQGSASGWGAPIQAIKHRLEALVSVRAGQNGPIS